MSTFFWKPIKFYLERKGWFYVNKVFGESISNAPREHFLLLLFKTFRLPAKLLLGPSLECQCDFCRFWKSYTAQKTKFSIKDPQETVDLVTFTEEIFNGKLHSLWQVIRL